MAGANQNSVNRTELRTLVKRSSEDEPSSNSGPHREDKNDDDVISVCVSYRIDERISSYKRQTSDID